MAGVVTVCGCGGSTSGSSNGTPNVTNSLMSIGVLDSQDQAVHKALANLFITNGIRCGLEGTIKFDVMIYKEDVDRARALLKRVGPIARFSPNIR